MNYEELSKILFPKDFIGAIVNLSFCSELLLKSMMLNIKRGHELEILFEEIEPKWKAIIKEKMGYNDTIFTILLKDISDYFEKWRYYYEIPEKDRKAEFKFLRNFTIVLMSLAHSKYHYEKGNLDKISEEDIKLIKRYKV